MRTISVANQKGGCGKTTVAVNLASALARAGMRVLLVDNDPQGHASLALGLAPGDFSLTTRDLYLTSDVHVEDARIEIREGLHVVPADIDLATVEPELASAPHRVTRLLERLAVSHTPYEVLLVDNPPNVGLLTFNALLASREVLVPVDAGRFSLEALHRLRQTLDMLARERGHRTKMHVLANGFDLRTRYARDMLHRLDETFPGDRLETLVHSTIRLREAAHAGEPIDAHDASSRAATDFERLAAEVGSMPLEILLEAVARENLPRRGPRVDGGRVEFVAHFPQAARVAVTGDFTGWSVQGRPLSQGQDGRWHLEVPLEPGYHEYKYIVDEIWKVDPENPERVRNGFGELNSVVVVPARAKAAAARAGERS
jgi:chromosome partitioning protein